MAIELEDVKRYRPEPGDVLVLRVDGSLTEDAADTIIDYLRRVFPNNKAIVLDGSTTLEVVSRAPSNGADTASEDEWGKAG